MTYNPPAAFLYGVQGLDRNDTHDYSQDLTIIPAVLLALVVLLCTLRIMVRTFLVHRVSLDDVLLIIGAIFTVACGAVIIHAATHVGLGKHLWVAGGGDIAHMETIFKATVKNMYLIYVLYAVAIAFTKLSIIASYLRIIPNRGFRIAMYATGTVVAAMIIPSIFCVIYQQTPPESSWDLTIKPKNTINYIAFLWAGGLIGLVTDLILTLLPIPLFWMLQMQLRQKIILNILFGLSISATVASALRMSQIPRLRRGIDTTHDASNMVLWSIVEISVGIICVSIPPLRPLVMIIMPRILLPLTGPSKSDIPPHTHSYELSSFDQNDRHGSKRKINVVTGPESYPSSSLSPETATPDGTSIEESGISSLER